MVTTADDQGFDFSSSTICNLLTSALNTYRFLNDFQTLHFNTTSIHTGELYMAVI